MVRKYCFKNTILFDSNGCFMFFLENIAVFIGQGDDSRYLRSLLRTFRYPVFDESGK